MPSQERTALVKLKGGLDTISDRLSLFEQPGKTIKMVNFEGGINGGYRRISGYTKYSEVTPDGSGVNPVVSAYSYFNGCVAVQAGDIYFSEDGTSWLQVNKDTGDTFVDSSTLAGLSTLTRNTTNAERYNFVAYHNGIDRELFFVDNLGTNPLGRLVIRDNAGTIEYKYQHAGDTEWGAGNQRLPTILEIHNERLVVSGDPSFKNEVYYSDLVDPFDFVSGGLINVSDEVVWVQTFRENLIVFCKNSIKAVAGLGDPSLQNIDAITNNIGCLAGRSVQEFAGGLIFLAPDGLRTVAATQRLDDFELGTLTTDIHNQILGIIEDLNDGGYITSTTVRSRNQYRLFLHVPGGTPRGIGGVIRGASSSANALVEWNRFLNYPVYDVHGTRNDDNNETIFQVNQDPFVYLHDTGNTFDGTFIRAYFQTPEMIMDDPNIRKTLHYVDVYTELEGPVDYSFKILYDEDFQNAASPGLYELDKTQPIAIYDVSEYNDPLSVYDVGGYKINRVGVQGSGKLISFIFQSTDDSFPFTIQSLNISYFLNGRY